MTTKITVSLPDGQVEALRAAVRAGRAKSVSALVAETLEEFLPRETLADVLAEWNAEDGPPTAEDYAWAKKAMFG